MKKFHLTPKLILIGFFGLLYIEPLAQISNGFKSKQHTAATKKPNLSAQLIVGKQNQSHFLRTQPFKQVNQPFALARRSITANLRAESAVQVIKSRESGLPIFISTPALANNARTEAQTNTKTASFAYLNQLSATMGLDKPEQNFMVTKIEIEQNGKALVRLNQRFSGLKVLGAEAIVHLDANGNGETFNGKYHLIKSTVDTVATISPELAIQIAVNDLANVAKFSSFSEVQKTLLPYSEPQIEKVVVEEKSLLRSFLLAFQVSIRPNLLEEWIYTVNAKSGKIIEKYKNTCHADGPRTATATDVNGVVRTINTYQEGSSYILADASKAMYKAASKTGIILTYDANSSFGKNFKIQTISSSNNSWNTPKGVAGHYNAGLAYDYFKNTHNRNSIDGKGGDIISIINVADDDGTALDNAYWNGKAMFYGNGNTSFKPMAGSLDVAGHEMTHGVVQSTANLKYEGESGAINESMADIFGCMMDSTDWLIGEDVTKTSAYPSGALRSMSDPHNGGTSLNDNGFQPKTMGEKYIGTEDYGGVHINSGIPNWAFYKYAIAVGRFRASKVFYRALTNYLTASSQFIDLRIAVIQSAKDLYGSTSKESTQAASAFQAVGITDGTTETYTSTLPTNPGTEYLLSYDTDDSNTDGLYRSPATATNFTALVTKTLGNKPSVTDDGSYAVFVGTDKKLYRITLDPSKTFEIVVIQDEAIWSNVAISKDGNRIAAIAADIDTSIYVYDFNIEKWSKFALYNPTFTEGVKSSGPLYADAIEWDYSGENLIYDCFNRITNSNGDDIEYWDINILNAWDKGLNKFTSGDITKLFNNLEEGESIGNPVFAKKSPNVIAFDYFNAPNTVFGIFGLDIEKNDLNVIALNNTFGHPSFNRDDSRLAFGSYDNSNNLNTYYAILNTDKISADDTQYKLIDKAKWPIYFSLGTRKINTSNEKVEENSILFYPNPTTNELFFSLEKNSYDTIEIEVLNNLGLTVLKSSYMTTELNLKIDVSKLNAGIYYLKANTVGTSAVKKFIKQD